MEMCFGAMGFQFSAENTGVGVFLVTTRRVKADFSCFYFFTSNDNAASLPSFSLIFSFSSFSSTITQLFVSR